MNDHLKQIAIEAIKEARGEGLDDEDAMWMATGALLKEGRVQGAIGETLSPEMNAALQTLVKQVSSNGS